MPWVTMLAPIPLGACYLAPSLGYILASLFGGRWIDYIMAREAKKVGRFDPDTGAMSVTTFPQSITRGDLSFATTRDSLELCRSVSGSIAGSLLGEIDRCQSAAGRLKSPSTPPLRSTRS